MQYKELSQQHRSQNNREVDNFTSDLPKSPTSNKEVDLNIETIQKSEMIQYKNHDNLYPDLKAVSSQSEDGTNQRDEKLDPDLNNKVSSNMNERAFTTLYSRKGGSKIVVTFTGDISQHTMQYYFENTKKSGGGEIKRMDFSPNTGVAVIEFQDSCSKFHE